MRSPSVGRSLHTLVIEEGLDGETLVAVLMAILDDRPPYVRINATLTGGWRRAVVTGWAADTLARGVRAAILRAEDFEEVCRAETQGT